MVRKIKKVVRNPDGTLRVVEIVAKDAKTAAASSVSPTQTAKIAPQTVELGVAALRKLVENSVLQAKFPAIKEAATQLAALGDGCWSCNREIAAKRGPILNKVRKFLASMGEEDAQFVKTALGATKFRVRYVDEGGNVQIVEK